MKKFIIITFIILICIVPLSFSEARNSVKERMQSIIMTIKNQNGKWVKVSDNVYLDTSSISKTKYLVSGWFKIYDTPEDDLSTIDGVDVYYAINKYEVDCNSYYIGIRHLKTFNSNNNILEDEENNHNVYCKCRALVNGELICKELCKRF